jgi:hypothetical protein
MRIAISGTHCSGKSTLVEQFLRLHRDYAHEPEPFEWLEQYGEEVAEEPDAESFFRQLEISVERLSGYAHGAHMIAERSPLDFLAYLQALDDLSRAGRDCELMASAVELAAAGMSRLDLLVILPLNDVDGIVAPEAEDLELREVMDDRLLDLIATDPYALFTRGTPRIVEIRGTSRQRLLALEQAVAYGVTSSESTR